MQSRVEHQSEISSAHLNAALVAARVVLGHHSHAHFVTVGALRRKGTADVFQAARRAHHELRATTLQVSGVGPRSPSTHCSS